MNLEELVEQSNQQEVSNFKDSLNRYLKKWPWLLLGLIIGVLAAFAYLKLVPNRYKVESKVQIIKSSNSYQDPTELIFGNRTSTRSKGLSDEMILFKSFPLVKETIKELSLNVHYYRNEDFNEVELYEKSPIKIFFDSKEKKSERIKFSIDILDDEKFRIINTEESEKLNDKIKFNTKFRFKGYDFTIVKTDYFNSERKKRKNYSIKINPIDTETYSYRNKLKFDEQESFSSILTLSMQTTLPKQSIDFINKITENYIQQSLEDKNQVSKKTVEFIDRQLAVISDSLDLKEKNLEEFKSSESLGGLSIEGELLIEKYNQIETERAKYEVMQQYYDYLQEKLESSEGQNVENLIAPSAFGIQDVIINDLVKNLVEINFSIAKMKNEEKTKNPLFSQLQSRRAQIINSLEESIVNLSNANKIILKDLQNRSNEISSSAQQLPVTERKLVNLNRLLKLNENIYLFLMEKRSSAAITMSSNTPDCKVIEPAMLNPVSPIAPNRRLIYLISIVIGIFIPLIIIIVNDLLNDTIRDEDTIKSALPLSIIGSIPSSSKHGDPFIAYSRPKSVLAESFRIVRTNLSFFQKKKFPYVILITSTVSKEGKTMSAINLSSILAASGKKTVLLGFDLRKPQLHNYLNLSSEVGISNYLATGIPIEKIITKSKQENLSIIHSGSIPPNPAELIIDDRNKLLFKELKERFDYIVVDTPPVGLVADALILQQESDLNIYVLRQGFSKNEYIAKIRELYKSGKMKNLSILFNDVEKLNRYDSGYYENAKPKKNLFRNKLRKS